MTNLQVAKQYVGNALAYATNRGGTEVDDMKRDDLKWRMKTVIANLEKIEGLLEKPDEENEEHDWNDFK